MRLRRPSPALVVAIVALVAALAGGATAATISSLSKPEKKTVKRIANKQITKKVPKLIGKSAESIIPNLNFQALNLENGWTQFGGAEGAPGIALGADGTVRLHGAIKGGVAGTTAFTVPGNMRPTNLVFVPVNMGPGGFTGRLVINPNGQVQVQDDPNTAVATAFTSLSASYTLPY